MNIKTKNWIYMASGFMAVMLVVVFANSKLLFGALPGAPIVTPPKPVPDCGFEDFSVTKSPLATQGPVDVNVKGVEIGRVRVRTQNCRLPLSQLEINLSMRHDNQSTYSPYYVGLANTVANIAGSDGVERGIFADTVLNHCFPNNASWVGTGINIFLDVQGDWGGITNIAPQSEADFVIRADLFTHLSNYVMNNPVLADGTLQGPGYHLQVDILYSHSASKAADLGILHFISGGQAIDPASVRNSC